MKLHLTRAEGRNLFSGYGAGYVAINDVRYERSLIVLPDRILDWGVADFEHLTEAALSGLASLPLEILILGTGARLRFPHPSTTRPLQSAGIALEVMDTRAACRTYNILLAEDRRVGAALLVTRED
ncbi:MAG TPA: Mth938-like domain-containing protein [Burkholderiales bacterium]|nr:Mth938-like domain-containing protein [Burkholderiales bacterium]